MTAHDQHGMSGGDPLSLLFACCHPALAQDAQVVLALRVVTGLTTDEIATVFVGGAPAVDDRLTAARQKIADAGIRAGPTPDHRLPDRLPGVLTVIYLLFTYGYTARRPELRTEAIRLGRLLGALMPDEPEALGLLALMLLHDARRAAQVTSAGDPVPLDEQDRDRWDRAQIDEGCRLLQRAVRFGAPGTYQLQAAIAAEHASAVSSAHTDWPRVVALYDELLTVHPSPVVALNHAVAVAMADGPAAGLALIETIDGLERFHLLHAARADLLRRLGRLDEAVSAYRTAYELAVEPADRRALLHRIHRLTDPAP